MVVGRELKLARVQSCTSPLAVPVVLSPTESNFEEGKEEDWAGMCFDCKHNLLLHNPLASSVRFFLPPFL